MSSASRAQFHNTPHAEPTRRRQRGSGAGSRREAGQRSHRALAILCDVSDDAQVEAMIERTVAEFGRLDAAFNNAKIAPTADSTLEEFDRVIGVNLRGGWSWMKQEPRQMERQSSGAIVNCYSIGGLTGDPRIPSYTA